MDGATALSRQKHSSAKAVLSELSSKLGQEIHHHSIPSFGSDKQLDADRRSQAGPEAITIGHKNN
jgi:hypothetical protein